MANGGNPRKLKAQVRALQLNTAGLLKLLGGNDDDRLRFWEILKGITTPRDVVMVSNQLDTMKALIDQAQITAKAVEKAAKQMGG